jgi:dienelactone hydrolase
VNKMKKLVSGISGTFFAVILISFFSFTNACTSGEDLPPRKQNEGMKFNESITVTPTRALVDTPLEIHLTGFTPGQEITVQAKVIDAMGIAWESQAVYETGADGNVDLNEQAPVSGPYKDADPMGLIWSMTPSDKTGQPKFFIRPLDLSPITIAFAALRGDKVVANSQAVRLQQADGVKRIVVRKNGLFGTLFLPPGDGPHPAITLVSGSGGGLSEPGAALFASHGYAGFALAYFNYETLPKALVEIPLEYFKKAIQYLQSLDSIDSERLAISGGSRGGELALLLGSSFPQYKAVIADVPSNVLWGGFGYKNAGGPKPAWVYKGKAIPFMDNEPDTEIYAYVGEYIKRGEAIPTTQGFLETMRRFPETLKKAEIPVEKINGPILMISGDDDQMWPSAQFSDMAMDRLKAHNFEKPFSHFKYSGAGHAMPAPYFPCNAINIKHPVDGGFYALGGTPEANYRAGVDSWNKKLEFLKKYLSRLTNIIADRKN